MTSEDIKHQLIINLVPKHARKHETHPPLVWKRVPSRFKRLWFYLCWCKLCWWLLMTRVVLLVELFVTDKLTTVWAPTKKLLVTELTIFWTRQWLKEGCRKPVLGVRSRPWCTRLSRQLVVTVPNNAHPKDRLLCSVIHHGRSLG